MKLGIASHAVRAVGALNVASIADEITIHAATVVDAERIARAFAPVVDALHEAKLTDDAIAMTRALLLETP